MQKKLVAYGTTHDVIVTDASKTMIIAVSPELWQFHPKK